MNAKYDNENLAEKANNARETRALERLVFSLIALALIVICGIVSIEYGADGMWDLKNYHLYDPFEAYYDRYMVDVAPAQLQSYFNPLLDFPFFGMISLINDRPRLIAFVMGTVQGLNLTAIVLIAWHCLRSYVNRSGTTRAVVTAIALGIGATGAGALPLIGTTTGDLPASTPILWSLYVLLRGIDATWVSPGVATRHFAIAGLLAGFGAGAKLTMGLYGLSLAATLLVLPWRSWLRAYVLFLAGAAAGFVVTGAYHPIRMFLLFDSPMFPLMNGLFHSPYWENAPIRDMRFLPKSLSEDVFYPFIWAAHKASLAAELEFRDIRIGLVIAVGALLVLFKLLRRFVVSRPGTALPPSLRALAVFFVVTYVIWLKLFAIYRYILPLEMLSGVLILVAIGVMIRPAWAWIGVSLAVAVACYVTTVPLEWGHTPFQDRYIKVTGASLPANTLVAIVGMDPISYFIPFFPKDAVWISLTPNFLNPDQNNLLVRREHELMANHKGPTAVLEAGATPAAVASTLASFGMSSDETSCTNVSSNLGGEIYKLCRTTRK